MGTAGGVDRWGTAGRPDVGAAAWVAGRPRGLQRQGGDPVSGKGEARDEQAANDRGGGANRSVSDEGYVERGEMSHQGGDVCDFLVADGEKEARRNWSPGGSEFKGRRVGGAAGLEG